MPKIASQDIQDKMKKTTMPNNIEQTGGTPNHTPVSGQEKLWNVEEVANYLDLQPSTVRRLAREGIIPAIKIGRVWRFQKSRIDQKLALSENAIHETKQD